MALRTTLAVMLGGLVATLAPACGGSPAAPIPAPTAPIVATPVAQPQLIASPSAPAEGATVTSFGAFYLTATNAKPVSGEAVMLTLDMAEDAAFTVKATSRTTVQTTGAETQFPIEVSYPTRDIGKTLYWRVRASQGETVGPVSPTRRIVLGDRSPVAANRWADPPTLAGPVSGSTQPRQARVRVRVARHSDGGAGYQFEAAEDPGFVHGRIPCINSEAPTEPEVECSFSFARTGHYYWRAQTISIGNGSSLADGFHSAWSDTFELNITDEKVNAPIPISPGFNTIDYPRPTFVVGNASVIGAMGPIAYRFEVFTDAGGYARNLVASATVPQGNGQTQWTMPFDLAVGVKYYWAVTAIDTVSGIESDRAGNSVLVMPRTAQLYTLFLSKPDGGPCGYNVSFAASSYDSFSGSSLTLTTSGSLTLTISRQGNAGAGTLGGQTYTTIVRAAGSAVDPAPAVVSTWTPDLLSGTFDGTYMHDPDGYYRTCVGSGFKWNVTKR